MKDVEGRCEGHENGSGSGGPQANGEELDSRRLRGPPAATILQYKKNFIPAWMVPGTTTPLELSIRLSSGYNTRGKIRQIPVVEVFTLLFKTMCFSLGCTYRVACRVATVVTNRPPRRDDASRSITAIPVST